MITPTCENERLEGGRYLAALTAWLALVLLLIALQAASQWAAFHELHNLRLTSTQLQGLNAMGLSIGFIRVWRFLVQLPNPLVWGGLGFFLFWRRSHDRSALVVSAMMVGIGTAWSIPSWQAFVAYFPRWAWVVPIVALIGNVCANSFFFVFPTGRYVPRWAVVPAVVLAMYNILNSYGFALPTALVTLGENLDWAFPLFALGLLTSVTLGPIYRYRISAPLERQQIKMVVFTIVFAFALFAAAASTVFLAPKGDPYNDISVFTVFVQPIGWDFSLLLIPVAILLSILRHRLFDIDIIIRKTLVYSLLSGSLALLYFGSVLLLQTLFGAVTAEQSPIVLVLSTLLIAALFAPLRRRIQEVIDRRFFRKKYNAQQVLAQFAQTARDEVDLDRLTAAITAAIQETVQPTTLSVWLKPSELRRRMHQN